MTEKLVGNDVSSASLVQREGLRAQFQKLYGEEARVFRAPGRVNLIGEHTDYNEGFVMPVEMDLQDVNLRLRRHWSAYVLGVAASLRMSGAEISGANLLVEGKVPMGA